jgi:hypothetical protein
MWRFTDGVTFELEDTLYPPAPQYVNALMVDDVNQDGRIEILIGGDSGLMVYDDGAEELLWQMQDLGTNLGRHNHILSRDIDADGRKEVIIGSNIALLQFD